MTALEIIDGDLAAAAGAFAAGASEAGNGKVTAVPGEVATAMPGGTAIAAAGSATTAIDDSVASHIEQLNDAESETLL